MSEKKLLFVGEIESCAFEIYWMSLHVYFYLDKSIASFTVKVLVSQ